MNSKQLSAANGAIKTKSVLSGHWIERAEIGRPGEFDHMSDAELLLLPFLASSWLREPSGCD